MLLDVWSKNAIRLVTLQARTLRHRYVGKLLPGLSQLQEQSRSDRREYADTARRQKRETAALETRVDVGLEVVVVRVLLKAPEDEVEDDDGLDDDQQLRIAGNMSSRRFNLLAGRTISPLVRDDRCSYSANSRLRVR